MATTTWQHSKHRTMLVAKDRKLRRGQQADILNRLERIFRRLAAIASGQVQWKAKRSGHRQRSSTSHGQSYEGHKNIGRRVWLVKREISLWRLGIVVCMLSVLLWIGWQIIARTAAMTLARSEPDAALRFVDDHHVALNLLAEKELLGPDGNLDTARELAQRALRSSPLNARSLTLLGLIAEKKGDQETADALMRIAVGRTWHDFDADRWLLNREAQSGDYAHALLYADAILRIDSLGSRSELFPVLASFTVDPRALGALTAILATSPPWRPWFLSELSARLANQTRLVQLYTALNDTGNPPTKIELRPYLDRLIKDENFEVAYQTWRATLPLEQRSDVTFPFNRNFQLPVDNLPFNWSFTGADVQVVSSTDSGKKPALFVEYSGARVDGPNVKQLVLLPPGDYSFSGRVKTAELRTSRGLRWRIFCADTPATTIANTELVSGAMPWTDFTINFQVPALGCAAQWLQLEQPARVASESRIEGQVWYQDLRITPASDRDKPVR